MKKILKPMAIGMFAGLFILSCSNQIKISDRNGITVNSDMVNKTYYTKDAKKSFSEFLKNPDENSRKAISARSARMAEGDDAKSYTEEEMFAEMWSELSEKEKQLIIDNADSVNIQFDSDIGVNKNSEIGRAATVGNTKDIDALAEYYGIIEFLKETGGEKTVPVDLLGSEFTDIDVNEVSVAPVLEMFMRTEEWDKLKEVLTYIGEEDKYREIKNRWETINNNWNKTVNTARGSLLDADGDYSVPLVDNIGGMLNDGDVLVTCNRKKAWVIAGDWSHGGIFSEDLYSNKDKDRSYCVYTAEPGTYNEDYKPENDTDPDRWGVACLETIYAYTKAKRFAVLHPKNYSTETAEKAVEAAKTIYYDTKAPYHLPIQELIWLGDTSHDLTKNNTYCTKVAYTAWKKNGVDLDADNFVGNLVSPDEIYGSSIRRTFTLKISILWWSYTKTWVTYEPTTTVLLEKYR